MLHRCGMKVVTTVVWLYLLEDCFDEFPLLRKIFKSAIDPIMDDVVNAHQLSAVLTIQ